ncbi:MULTISPECIES: hypothetical protein [unclassified Ensifer]|uniref:hypothetical protein n=1 Tax=unclassified Ensifer TaxID=2633371 RepID=UPI0030101195
MPALEDGFSMVMRLYGPSKEAQDGIWKAPQPTRGKKRYEDQASLKGTRRRPLRHAIVFPTKR